MSLSPGWAVVKLEFEVTENEKEARSSSDSHDGRAESAGAGTGDGGLTKSLSRAGLREPTFLFFADDVMTVSCLCSSGTTREG